jgi:hypothetical protein
MASKQEKVEIQRFISSDSNKSKEKQQADRTETTKGSKFFSAEMM